MFLPTNIRLKKKKTTTTVSTFLQLKFLKRISGSSLLIQALLQYLESKYEKRKDLRLFEAEEYVPLGKEKKNHCSQTSL